VNYTVKIFDDFDGMFLENELTTISGDFQYSGLHTVDLPDTVNLPEGDDFYVFLYLSNGGFPYDRTSEVPVLLGANVRVIVPSTASPGESYFSDEGSWTDFYYYNDNSGFQNTGNICIKALAVHDPSTGLKPEMNIINGTSDQNYPNPFTDKTTISYNLQMNAYVELAVYSLDGKLVKTLVSKEQNAGEHMVDWEAEVAVKPGVYIYRLRLDGLLTSTKKMLKMD